jgi:uncharacterized protein (UPF0332 family)
MAFPYNEYLDLAKELSKTDKPAYLRSAISRAYYAVYIRACFVAGENNQNERSSHKDTIKKFTSHEDDEAQELGEILQDLRKNRNQADYDGFYNVDLKKVNFYIEKSEAAMQLLEDIDGQVVFD